MNHNQTAHKMETCHFKKKIKFVHADDLFRELNFSIFNLLKKNTELTDKEIAKIALKETDILIDKIYGNE